MAKVMVFLADSTFPGSPPEVINLIPANATKNTAAILAKMTAWLEILLKKTGIQAKEVGEFGSEQLGVWAKTKLGWSVEKTAYS